MEPRGLEPTLSQAVLMVTLARANEGILVCDGALNVTYASSLAVRHLAPLGPAGEMPATLREIVQRQCEAPTERSERLPLPQGGGALRIRAARLPGAEPERIVVWVRKEALRNDHVYNLLRERYPLSNRGFQLVQLLRRGLTNRQIGAELKLTESTVKTYLHELYRECGVTSRTSLLALLDDLSVAS